MIDYKGEKFKQYLHRKGIGATEAAKILGVSRQTVYQYFKSQHLERTTVSSILDKFNDSSEEIFGVTYSGHSTYENARALGELKSYDYLSDTKFIEISPGRYRMKVPLVPEYARAGYLSGFSDPEYMESLPIHEPIVEKYHRGRYMAFEVSGDSMDDDSKRSIPHGSIVTAREIKRELWRSRFHTHRYPHYVIVHNTEGVIIKEIVKQDIACGTITLRSLNPDKETYPDFDINLDDVKQIFNVVKKEETY